MHMSVTENCKNSGLESVDSGNEISRLTEELEALQRRHRILDSILPHWHECTGIIQSMRVIEENMAVIEQRIRQLKSEHQVA